MEVVSISEYLCLITVFNKSSVLVGRGGTVPVGKLSSGYVRDHTQCVCAGKIACCLGKEGGERGVGFVQTFPRKFKSLNTNRLIRLGRIYIGVM